MQGLSDAADLSDRTFKALDEKAARLRKLKVATHSHTSHRSNQTCANPPGGTCCWLFVQGEVALGYALSRPAPAPASAYAQHE